MLGLCEPGECHGPHSTGQQVEAQRSPVIFQSHSYLVVQLGPEHRSSNFYCFWLLYLDFYGPWD